MGKAKKWKVKKQRRPLAEGDKRDFGDERGEHRGNLNVRDIAPRGSPELNGSYNKENEKTKSPNWGGRRPNQTGRPRIYQSDEERRAAAASRRRAARASAKAGTPKLTAVPRDVPSRSSWGGARPGAGRPMIFKTPEERRRRNRELSRESALRWWSNPENVRRYEESRARANQQLFTQRQAVEELEQKRSNRAKIDEWEQLKRALQEQQFKR